MLRDVLYIPKLSYNLLSVAKASQRGKIVKFTRSACYILNKEHKMVAKATTIGSLYHLNHKPNHERATFTEKCDTQEHKRFGHLGIGSLQKLAREQLADGFDFDTTRKLTFCESCPQGKQHHTKFSSSSRRADEPFDLVHNDLCRKIE